MTIEERVAQKEVMDRIRETPGQTQMRRMYENDRANREWGEGVPDGWTVEGPTIVTPEDLVLEDVRDYLEKSGDAEARTLASKLAAILEMRREQSRRVG